MKNKKLFAILTLVCFMFTLMPVAAFAADYDGASQNLTPAGSTTAEGITFNKVDGFYLVKIDANDTVTEVLTTWGPHVPVLNDEYALVKDPGVKPVIGTKVASLGTTFTVSQGNVDAYKSANATAVVVADSISSVEAEFDSEELGKDVNFSLNMRDRDNKLMTTYEEVYVWVTAAGSNTPVDTVKINGAAISLATTAPYVKTYATTGDKQFTVKFNAPGKFDVHVSSNQPVVVNGAISAASQFAVATVEAYSTASLKVDDIRMDVKADGINKTGLVDGDVVTGLVVEANNVEEKTVEIKLYDKNGNPLQHKTVNLEVYGAVGVSKETVNTGVTGKAEFAVSGHAEGTYKVYVEYGKFEVVIEVQVGATGANTIECTESPVNPIDILGDDLTAGIDAIEFTMYDVNGNVVKSTDVRGSLKARNSDNVNYTYAPTGETVNATGYVAVVEQPAASKLENKNLKFDGTTIVSSKPITVEGTYTFKVVLDNGAFATATIVVKEFTTPEELVLVYPTTVELGATIAQYSELYWLDADKVRKDAKNIELAATGYAIADFDAKNGKLVVKTDEKYIGSEITITAVDERYNKIDTVTVKVADDAKELKFASNKADVNVNNHITVNVVDSQGNKVVLGSESNKQQTATVISYVILEKPEDANVFVSTVSGSEKLAGEGSFKMNLTSNKVGNVVVQAVVKYSELNAATGNYVTKYYTGTEVFAVGTEGTGDVVVMSIGSTEIVKNDVVSDMGVAPIIENGRTFVPYRAGLEALGATVAYDEAAQAVTAEMNGVTVVMTIGSKVYTINGVEHTMDVAPFIKDSRTMVPARFAAQAFGITVIPTQNPDGTTADVLYIM